MNFLGILLFTLFLSTCSKKGHPESSPIVAKAPELPFEDDALKYHSVKVQELPIENIESLRCESSSIPNISTIQNSISIDGDLSEWMDNQVLRQVLGAEQDSRIWGGINDEGLFLGLQGFTEADTWTVELVPYYVDSDKLKEGESQKIVFSPDGSVSVSGANLEQREDLSYGKRDGVGGELFISSYILDRVRLYPIWQIRISISNEVSVSVPALTFSSQYSGNNEFTQKYCASEEPGMSFNWFIESSVPEDIYSDLNSLLAWASMDLKTIYGSSIEITVFVPDDRDMRSQGDQNVWVDFEALQERDSKSAKVKILSSALHRYLIIWLGQAFPETSDTLRTVVAHTMKASFLRKRVGELFHLRSFHLVPQSEPDYQNLGALLAYNYSFDEILDFLKECRNYNEGLSVCLLRKMKLDSDRLISFENLVESWLKQDDGFDRSLSELGDADGDGLPEVLERLIRTSVDLSDSDSDGWSDLSEYILKTDSRNPINHPESIVYDGIFSEWFDLIPARMNIDDRGEGSQCNGIDIAFYAALKKKDSIVIGASLEKIDPDMAMTWVVTIDDKTNQSLAVKVVSGGYYLEYIEDGTRLFYPFAMGKGELEFELPVSSDAPIDLRIELYQNGEQFCDDTPWFQASPG